MNSTHHVPPGFRFHPTDEELVDYYLRNKVNSSRIDLDVIKHVDLYKIEPWDLQELCRVGTEEQSEWYFFSHKDKKYPTGTRTNRATTAGFWKATGRDKAIYSKHELIGMRKTLVFYKGRAPNGQKSDWIMHEYRLETDENNGTSQEEGWVVCRVFKKRVTTNNNMRQLSDHDDSPSNWYDNNNDQHSFMQQQQQQQQDHHYYFDSSPNSSSSSSSKQITHHPNHNLVYQQQFPLLIHHLPPPREHFLHQQHLDINPTKLLIQQSPAYSTTNNHPIMAPFGIIGSENHVAVTDWRVLDDKFVSSTSSSQLIISSSQEEEASMMIRRSSSGSNAAKDNWDDKQQQEEMMMISMMPQNNNNNASTTSNSSCPMDMWK